MRHQVGKRTALIPVPKLGRGPSETYVSVPTKDSRGRDFGEPGTKTDHTFAALGVCQRIWQDLLPPVPWSWHVKRHVCVFLAMLWEALGTSRRAEETETHMHR